jgi:hypothetical protein
MRFISLVTNEETASVRKIERILGKKFEKMNPSAQQRHSRGHRSGRNNFHGKPNAQRQLEHRSNKPNTEKTSSNQNNPPKQQTINKQNKKSIK